MTKTEKRWLSVYFICCSAFLSFFSLARHAWFQSNAWDLGIFDQAIYLVSQGYKPISTFLDFHILGDHAAFVLYPIGLIYRAFPSAYLILILQSVAITSCIYPLYDFAHSMRLSEKGKKTTISFFLLFPIIFNLAIFDFHPEALALPVLTSLACELERKSVNTKKILLLAILSLTCKITISIFIAGFGVRELLKRRNQIGGILLALGVAWFLFSSKLVIPFFGDSSASLARHASKFGLNSDSIFAYNSIFENLSTLSMQIWNISNLEYLVLLTVPVFFLFLATNLKQTAIRLIPFYPLLAINLISTSLSMKSLVFQYSVFLVPLLAIETTYFLQENGNRMSFISKANAHRIVIITSLVSFLALSRITFFFNQYHSNWEAMNELKQAIAMVNKKSSVLTSSTIAPHLSQRKNIRVADSINSLDVNKYDEILLDTANPGWKSSPEIVSSIYSRLNKSDNWEMAYQKKSVFLWKRSRLDG
ncbi:DUF2079 domain-containing protein [Synechococcus sp. AH-601-J22]|nr:DUF2079 domain-containing protein [Synechococcus sp. AH-601-J22]